MIIDLFSKEQNEVPIATVHYYSGAVIHLWHYSLGHVNFVPTSLSLYQINWVVATGIYIYSKSVRGVGSCSELREL